MIIASAGPAAVTRRTGPWRARGTRYATALGIVLALVSVGTGAAASPVRQSKPWATQLGLERAWQITKGAGVTVGLVDTGVDADHPDLVGAVLPGRAFPDLADGTGDAWGHGTAMAMVIAGRGRGDGVLGVAPQAMVLPAKFTGGGAMVNEAIRWVVDHGATVINLSVGGDRPSGRGAEAAYDEGLRYAQEHDVVIVAAAGNRPRDTAVVSPANRPGVIAVSAVDGAGVFRPEVSVEGPEMVLAAPGVGIMTPADAAPTRWNGSGSGTSYAAAVVSGAAALVRSRYPHLSAPNVVQRLIRTAKRPAGAGRDPRYGFGIVDPVAALTADVHAVDVNPLGSLGRTGTAVAGPRARSWVVPVAVVLGLAVAVGVGSVVVRTRVSARPRTGTPGKRR